MNTQNFFSFGKENISFQQLIDNKMLPNHDIQKKYYQMLLLFPFLTILCQSPMITILYKEYILFVSFDILINSDVLKIC